MENTLERFLVAQQTFFKTALAEIEAGKKTTHWMWYIFPQIEGLGRSATAKYYAIQNEAEARAFMQDKTLAQNLVQISEAALKIANNNAAEVFGYPDNLKLQSCMTLFAETAPEQQVFQKVLDKYFGGEKDRKTLELLKRG